MYFELCDNNKRWTGGNSIVVQVGDQIDGKGRGGNPDDNDLINQLLQHNDDVETPKIKEIDDLSNDDDDEIDYSDFERSL